MALPHWLFSLAYFAYRPAWGWLSNGHWLAACSSFCRTGRQKEPSEHRDVSKMFEALSADIDRQVDCRKFGYEEAEFTVQKEPMSFSTLTMFVSGLLLLSLVGRMLQ
jgi:hypothetical protein